MPTVTEAVTHGQRLIRRQEPVMTGRLLDAYRVVMQRVEGQLQSMEWRIAEAIAAGEPVSEAWLQRQEWWRQLEGSIQAEFGRFNGAATQTIGAAQMDALRAAQESERLFRVVIDMPFTGRVNAPAFERWVSAMQPNSPIRGVIDNYGNRASDAIRTSLTQGLGTGQGVGSIVRDIRRQVGPDAVKYRIRTLVRTEAMRAFRGGFEDVMAPYVEQGIVSEYRWLSARDSRVCIICIALDNRTYKTYQHTQHPSCRCVMQPVLRPDLAPGGRPRMSGADWFARQDAATQRAMMPSEMHYQLYKDGMDLYEMVGVRHDETWGETVVIRPARDLMKREAA